MVSLLSEHDVHSHIYFLNYNMIRYCIVILMSCYRSILMSSVVRDKRTDTNEFCHRLTVALLGQPAVALLGQPAAVRI